MKKIFLYITFMMLAAGATYAQDGLRLKIGYNTGMPLGSFKDFMGSNSFRGFHGELMYPVNEKITAGLSVSSQDYYEKVPRQLYDTKDGLISAVVSNSVQTTPILLKGSYNLRKEGAIVPYVGIGAGLNLVRFAQYLGEFGEAKTSFKFAAAADAGVNYFFNKQTRTAGINVGAGFNYMPYNKNNIKGLHNWGLHAGVFFPLR